jgi:Pyridoxamine 5'-phosphate oxidase
MWGRVATLSGMSALSFLFGAHPNPLFERGKRCVLTTLGASGRLNARKLKVATCSEDGARLWFVIPAGDGIDAEIAHNPSVTVSVIDADTLSLVHVSGVATPLRERSSPLYLRPNFRQALALNVVPAELDFTLLRVDLDTGLDLDVGKLQDRPPRHSSQ